jgi:hypothetical protein
MNALIPSAWRGGAEQRRRLNPQLRQPGCEASFTLFWLLAEERHEISSPLVWRKERNHDLP